MQLGAVAHRPHAAALFDLAVLGHHAQLAGLGQRRYVVLLSRHHRAHLGTAAPHENHRPLRGLQAIAVTHRPHHAHHLQHRLDVALGLLVHQGRLRLGVL